MTKWQLNAWDVAFCSRLFFLVMCFDQVFVSIFDFLCVVDRA